MKIAIFSDVFVPKFDGIVTSTLSLIKNLSDKGHKIYVIAPKFKNIKKEFKYKNVEVIRIPSIPAIVYPDLRLSFLFSYKLFRYLKREKIDIIHFQTPMNLGFQAIILSKLLKVPLVGTFHINIADPNFLKYAKINYDSVQKLSWLYLRSYYNRCNIITCPSESIKKELLKHKFYKPIKVISNGIDSEIFDNSKSREIKNKLNKNGKLILFVGRISIEKNVSYLLECFSLVLKKIPNVKLIIVGDGPEKNEVERKASSLGISEKVIFTGAIEHEKLLKSSIFKACDLFVTPSLAETQGISTLEAQSNGLVCVGLNVCGTKDIIKNNYNGILIDEGKKKEFAEAIIKLLSDKKLYLKFKKNTLKEIKKHQTPDIIKIYEKEYLNLIDKK